ncbi:MAG: DNA polymerase III subunit delta [Candidatus Omnitrophica bacterium]|nr:DNA polymerase III subunit delta [Candidatus Omnitrophota bacterium]
MASSATNIRLLIGGDSLQQKKAVDEIQQRRYGNDDVEQLRFDAATGDAARAIDEVISFSLFNPNRIVILDNIDTLKKDDLDILTAYAGRPRGDIPFLLLSPSQKDTPKALLKVLDKKIVRVLQKTGKGQIQKLIRDRCAERRIDFERDALELFMQLCGDHVETAMRELDKLLLWADDHGAITLELCRRLVQTEQDKNIWAITNAVGDKNASEALQALDLLLSQGDDEVAITGRLISTFRGIYHCKTLQAEKTPESQWGGKMGQTGYGLKMTKQRSQGFSLEALRKSIALLRRADNDLKGGRPISSIAHRRTLLERLVIDLCRME